MVKAKKSGGENIRVVVRCRNLLPHELGRCEWERGDDAKMLHALTNPAVVGYELDQVRRTPEGDVSVPINATSEGCFCCLLKYVTSFNLLRRVRLKIAHGGVTPAIARRARLTTRGKKCRITSISGVDKALN